LPGEDEEAFAALRESLRAELNPMGALESLLVDRIIDLTWRLFRAGKIEAAVLDRDERTGARQDRCTQLVGRLALQPIHATRALDLTDGWLCLQAKTKEHTARPTIVRF
jgi:hypothetical protein